MSSLAERLKGKGYELPLERPPAALHTLQTGATHKSLTTTSTEKRQLFTPLETRGQKAIQAETAFKKECDKDLLKGVKQTLLYWVQECLTNPERKQKLLEGGLMRCRVQAQWSNDLNNQLHAFIENLGGRVAAACEKENAQENRPAWEKYAARDEKWMIGFDVAAFDAYIKAHPQVLGPSDAKLRDFMEGYSRKVDIEVCTLRVLFDALETQFGPLTDSFKGRAQQVIAEVINSLEEGRQQRGSKKRSASDIGGLPKRARTCGLRSENDAIWAAEVLAPLGLKPGTHEPAVTVPPVVLAPVLANLKALEPSAELLRSTGLGVIVASYRHHSNVEIARAARELVASWKAACLAKKASS